MKIVILNVKYSPNLGDGAIAECLEKQLKDRIDGLNITSLDIGGMSDYGLGGSIVQAGLMRKLEKYLPPSLINNIKSFILPSIVKFKYANLWKPILRDCDLIIIGGGQLFMDVDHYFPSRLLIATSLTKKNIPIIVYAVGVSELWTKRGVKMINNIFNYGNLIKAYVRDVKSTVNWHKNINDIKPDIVRDPAFLSKDTYGNIRKEIHPSGRKIVAFGVSDPADLKKHSTNTVVLESIASYLDVIETLVESGFYVKLFTNGFDYYFLDKINKESSSMSKSVKQYIQFCDRARKPYELVEQIASSDVLVANRLHANIIAYSYKIPNIGLGWDTKLKSFFDVINRQDYIITENESVSENIISKVKKTIAVGIDEDMHSDVMKEAKLNFDDLANTIKSSM